MEHHNKCADGEVCSKIQDLMIRIHEKEGEERLAEVSKLSDFLSGEEVSLQTKICFERKLRIRWKTTKIKPQNSLLNALLTLPEGCEIIKKQLKSLVFSEGHGSVVGVKLGTKKLFKLDTENKFEQTSVLQELLSARNKMPLGQSYKELTALVKHPVIVAFVLEKWDKVRDSFFLHLR